MTIIVYVCDECQKEADQHNVGTTLARLVSTIEQEQAFWTLEPFEYPFWIKKRLGDRRTRLICRLEEFEEVQGEPMQVLVMLSVMQRGDKKYEELFVDILKHGNDLYSKNVDRNHLRHYVNQRSQDEKKVGKPAPSALEDGLLYAVRTQHEGTASAQDHDMVYESWSWVEQGLHALDKTQLADIAQRLAQIDMHHTPDDGVPYVLHESPNYRYVALFFAVHRLVFLTIEACHADAHLSERHVALSDIVQRAENDSRQQMRDYIGHVSRRVYPQLLWLDSVRWQNLQRDQFANLALSPQEADVLDIPLKQERPFPLFINGRAGSGKSTILQYLFADYLLYALQQKTQDAIGLRLAYFTCNQTLTDRASDAVLHLLKHSSRYWQEKDIEQLIKPSTVKANCLEFRGYIKSLIPAANASQFRRDKFVDYGKFRALWNKKFSKVPEMCEHYPASLCWHIIRSYIKGLHSEDYIEPEDYRDLEQAQRSVSDAVFSHVFERVWSGWYAELCEKEGYWDDQDLARYVLSEQYIQPTFAAIFCDEAQDFTRIELQIVLRLSLFSGRDVQPHEIQRVPLVFAGDQFQTLNPTGFRWDAIKSQVVEQFIFALDPSKQARLSEMGYKELTYNFRSTATIAKFSNIIHGLRARLFNLKQMRPQLSWHTDSKSRDVVYFNTTQQQIGFSISSQFDLVFVLPCLEDQEIDYIQNNKFLSSCITINADGSTSIPAISVIRAKGLEFERVVLFGFAADRPEGFEQDLQQLVLREDQAHLNVQYYLNRLYVAATRARSQLIIIEKQDDYAALWAGFSAPLKPPLQLDQLQAMGEWLANFGTLRQGELEDLTPDADHIRTMENNAKQFMQQGLDERDAFSLRQAAGLFGQLNNEEQRLYCLAQVCLLEEDFLQAGEIFSKINRFDQAYDSFWYGQHWAELAPLIDLRKMDYRIEHDAIVLHVRPSRSGTAHQQLLAKLVKKWPELNPDQAWRNSWRALLQALIEKLPIDQTNLPWALIYKNLLTLNDSEYFAMIATAPVLAEVAFLAADMTAACAYWDQAKEQLKLSPPSPRYEEATIQARQFPDTLDALLSLQRDSQLLDELRVFQAPNQFKPAQFEQILNFAQAQKQLMPVLDTWLPQLQNLVLLDQTIGFAQAHFTNKHWVKRVRLLRLLHACLNGDWDSVQQVLDSQPKAPQQAVKPPQELMKAANGQRKVKKTSPNASFKISPELLLLLHGLSHSQPYSAISQGDYSNPYAKSIMAGLKSIFQIEVAPKTRGLQSPLNAYQLQKKWRTDFAEVRLLGAVLERSHDFIEALSFYETLEEQQEQYAKLRWLGCKLRQAENAYALRDEYEAKARAYTDPVMVSEFESKMRDADDRAEKYMLAARRERKKLRMDNTKLPEYPELAPLDLLISKILQPEEVAAPAVVKHSASVTDDSSTESPSPQLAPTDAVTTETVSDTPSTPELPTTPVALDTTAAESATPVESSAPVEPILTVESVPPAVVLAQALRELESAALPMHGSPLLLQSPTVAEKLAQHHPVGELVEAINSASKMPTLASIMPKALQQMASPTVAIDTAELVVPSVAQMASDPIAVPVLVAAKPAAAKKAAKADAPPVAVVAASPESETRLPLPELATEFVTAPSPVAENDLDHDDEMALSLQYAAQTESITPNSAPVSPTLLLAAQPTMQPSTSQPSALQADRLHTGSLPVAPRLPTTALAFLDYRILCIRAQQRINIEHQLTGQQAAIFLQSAQVRGDWALSAPYADGRQALLGTELLLRFAATQDRLELSVDAHGLVLSIGI